MLGCNNGGKTTPEFSRLRSLQSRAGRHLTRIAAAVDVVASPLLLKTDGYERPLPTRQMPTALCSSRYPSRSITSVFGSAPLFPPNLRATTLQDLNCLYPPLILRRHQGPQEPTQGMPWCGPSLLLLAFLQLSLPFPRSVHNPRVTLHCLIPPPMHAVSQSLCLLPHLLSHHSSSVTLL